jgi:signal transduction histidine kinase
MHERAKAIGADLKILTEVGQGTKVIVIWSNTPVTGDTVTD